MGSLRDFFKNNALKRYVLFIVITAFLLFALFFLFKNLDVIFLSLKRGASSVLGTLSPLFIGMLIAYLFNPLVTTIHRRVFMKTFPTLEDSERNAKRMKRNRLLSVLTSYLIVFAAIIAIIYGFVVMIGGQLVMESVPKLINTFTKHFVAYQEGLKAWLDNLPSGMLSERLQEFVNKLIKWASESLSSGSIISTVKGVGNNVVNIVIGLVISIYLSYDKDLFLGMWHKFIRLAFPERVNQTIHTTLNEVNGVLSLFLRGILLDALIVAILTSVGLTILGIRFAVFLGIFAGLSNVIPYFGPVLGMIPAFIVGFMTSGVKEGLLAVLVLFIVQQIDSNLVYPRVVGGSTGLHPLFVLLAVTIGGAYGGLLGMIIAVPIAGVVQLFVLKWVKRREKTVALKTAFDSQDPDEKKET